MGIFQRAHDIAQAKANKALDAAEKPDEMLDLSYEKMLEQITQVRRALVDLAGSRKSIELQEQQFQHTIDHLQDQAKAALGQGREDLAKEALSRKAVAQEQIDSLEPQRVQLTEEEQKLTKTLDALQKRVNDFRTQKETLKAQYTAATAITSVNESAAGISKSFNDSGASLQRAQDKIATMQARSVRSTSSSSPGSSRTSVVGGRHPKRAGPSRPGRLGGQRARCAQSRDRHADGAGTRGAGTGPRRTTRGNPGAS